MSFKIDKGIPESELFNWLEDAKKKFDKFDDGRINYKKANIATVIMCTLKAGNKILIAKRGYGLADAEGYWSTINGFIDEKKSVKDFVIQELYEELGIRMEKSKIKVGDSFTLKNSEEKRSYIVFPCLALVDINVPIKLDHEHTETAWIERKDLGSYAILEDLPYVIDQSLKLE